MDTATLAARIRERLDEMGASASQVSRRAVGEQGAIGRIYQGHSPSFERACKIFDALGLEFSVGPPRTPSRLYPGARDTDPGVIPPMQLRALEDHTQGLVRVVSEAGGEPIPDDLWPALAERRRRSAPELSDDSAPAPLEVMGELIDFPDAKPVPVVELAAAAGDGSMVLNETPKTYAYFREGWLRRRSLDPTQCRIIGVRGDSMEPALQAGDSLLVDFQRRRRRAGHVYVMRTDDGVVVKRLEKDEEQGWLLVSDAGPPEWPAQPWPERTQIIGEVCWVGREMS